MEWVELGAALIVILVGAEMFTNGVEWVGEQHGLSEGAVGSVLAAVGTALPETILPLVAILAGSTAASEEIGIGAILGAPFMLTTLAMFVLGVAVLVFSRGGRRSTELDGEDTVITQDLGYFLVMYTLAVIAGLIHYRPLDYVLALFLIVSYGFYVRRHFQTPGEAEEAEEAEGEVKTLYMWNWTHGRGEREWTKDSPRGWTYTQVAVALLLIVGGAKLFVGGIEMLAEHMKISPMIFALLLAPVATELPEKFNSVLWVRRKKDTLALGNMTGAMVFQSSFPVSVGLLLTSWNLLEPGHPEALVSAIIALLAGGSLWITMKIRGRFQAWLLLLQGGFYAAYVIYVISRA
jgi:cation:H+ antiporter